MALSGIEIEIYRDSAPFTKIGVIEARKNPTILREIQADGAGSFTVSKNNPKILEKPYLLDYRNFARVRVNGVCLGGFILTNKDHVIVGEGEKADESWSLSGEGLRSWSKDAKVRPARGLSKYSRETRFFNFATEQGSWYNPAQWVNAVRVWGWNQPGNSWGTAPSDWPDAPTADWIWDRAQPPYEMPLGDVYFRKEFTLAVEGEYALFFAADDAAEVYMDGELIHTSAEMHSWQETSREDMHLEAGPHILAFKASQLVPVSPGALIAAFYKIGNATSPAAAEQIFVSKADGTWKVCPYPAVVPGWTPGNIILTLLAEAEARGVRFPANWTPTFTDTHDSAGEPWGDPLSISFDIGLGYDEVFDALEEAACDIYLDADDLKLYAWKKRGVDRTIENTEGNDPIILRIGHNLKTAAEKGQADIVNTLLLNTSDGWEVAQPENTDSVTKYGVVEGQVSTEMSSTSAANLVSEIFAKKATPEKTATFELIPVPGMVPFENFFEGDYVSAPGEVPGVFEKRRIMSLSASENEVGDPIYAIEFDAIFKDRTDELEKMLSKATHSSSLGGGFSGTTGTPQTVTQGSNPQLPVSAMPETPTGLVVTTTGRWADNGTAVSDFSLNWNAVASNIYGLPVTDIQNYEVWGRRSTDTDIALLATVFDTFAFLSGFNPGEEWFFQVRAASRTGGYSSFTDLMSLIAEPPVVPLGAPSTPTLVTEVGSVGVRWDGLIGGEPAPARYKYMEIQRSTTQNGTYAVVGSFVSGSGLDSTGIVGTLYWYRLVAVDYLGVRGTPSIAVSITVVGVDLGDLDESINDAINGAIETANTALTAANGKNKITFSNDEPTTSDIGIAGDIWYRRDGAGAIIGIWENTGGGTWVPREQSGETLVDVNAGTITTGFLGADRIAANTITSEKMLIANLDNQLDNPDFETNSFLGWIQTGSLLNWDTPTSTVDYINRYLRRTNVAAEPAGQITNGFRVAVRPEHRIRIDALSMCTGIAPGPWTETRRNYFADPRGTSIDYLTAPNLGTYSTVMDMPGATVSAVRFTRDTAGTARIALRVGTSMFRSTNGRFRLRARASEAMTLNVIVRTDPTSTTGQSTINGSYSLPAGVSEIDLTGPAGTAAATADTSLVILTDSGIVGATLDLTNVTIETAASGALGGPFSGSTVTGSDLEQYSWLGDEDDSQSIFQTRTAPSSIGAQFYGADGSPLVYIPRALESNGAWTPITWETNVPPGAYWASLRVEDAGVANSVVRLANLQFRLMGAGQLLVDGTIQGRHVAADTLEGRSIKASTIEVDRLSPNVGSSLNLDGNTNINALTNATNAQQDALTAQQQRLDGVDAAAAAANAAAIAAASAATAAQFTANGLQAGIQATQDAVDNLGRTYRFTTTGAFIGAPNSPYEFVIQNTGAEIRYNGVPVSSWDSGQMIVNSFVGNEVVLGNHKLEKDVASGGTVVRKIVSN